MIILADPNRKIKKALKVALVSFFVVALMVAYGMPWGQKNALAGLEASASNQMPLTNLPVYHQGAGNLQIEAPSAISIAVGFENDKVLFAKNETEQLPIASLTKLMTALVVFERYDVSQVHDLLFDMLIESSNEAAQTLSGMMGQEAFVAAMNARAKDLGMANTHFADSSGLSPQSVSSAQDVVTLAEYLFEQYPLFREIISLPTYQLRVNNQFYTIANTNKLLGQDNIIGGKTGFTQEAKGCMMVVQQSLQESHYIISVVLGSQDRFLETKHIIEWASQAYTWQ